MHPHGHGYLVVFAYSKTNLWQWAEFGTPEASENLDVSAKIKAAQQAKLIEFQQRELPVGIGKRTEEAWHRAVFGIMGGEKRSGLDGVTFVFRAYSKKNGRASWDAWSPLPNSLADHLGRVALALGRFCEDGSTRELEVALDDLQATGSLIRQ
ncbi:MAG: hypothetical protein JWM88_927 [Verrucomicrobia bacterium]|nr:hypothetical protein [Verrucomicrobiota bacterium]